MKQNSNPFYDWLSKLGNQKWGKLTIVFFTAALTGVGKWSVLLIERIFHTTSPLINHLNATMLFQLVTIALAIWFTYVYNRHFDINEFTIEMDKLFKSPKIKILKFDERVESKKLISYSIQTHRLFSEEIVKFYLCLFLIYLIFLVDMNLKYLLPQNITIPYTFIFADCISTIIKLIINGVAILVLLKIYYALTYSYLDRHLVRKRLLFLRFLVGFLMVLGSSIVLYRLILDYNDLFIKEILAITGILTGITFALLIGKLDGPLIGTPTPILWVGYSYSLLQATFFLFDGSVGSSYVSILVIYFAVLFKIILMIYFFWLIRMDRIIIYTIFHWNIYLRTANERELIENVLEEIEKRKENEYKNSN